LAGAWTVDPKTLVSLRLSEAERAIQHGDLDRALIEAEELLDEQPAHRRALEIASQAALGMGDVLTALASLNRFVELHPPDAKTLQSLAAARFQAVDFPGALAAAEQAAALDGSVGASWHYQGLALERIGKLEEAGERFARAAKLQPDQFPFPIDVGTVSWDDHLEAALGNLPQPIQVFYDGIPIRWKHFPAVADLLENYPPLSPFTDALYRGTLPEGGDPWSDQPTNVTLFQGNLSRPSNCAEDIVKRITEALMHEAMHWIGITDLTS
jgi:tetratricopeptide (TPR) repeat protein